MSARVFKPIAFAEIPKIRSSPSIEGSFVYKGFAKVRRSLFNSDPDGARRFVDEELAKLANDECDRWGFDFISCTPKDTTGRYEWTAVTPTKINIPLRPSKSRILENDDACNSFLYAPIASSSLTTLDDETVPDLTFADIHIQSNIPKKQSLITDFMQTRKRGEEPSLKKKFKSSNTQRPKKMARMSLADFAS